MIPFLKYPGGKIKEFPLVEKFKPKKITRYFEPFVGGGSVFLNIAVRSCFINDKSEDLMRLYKYIKNQDKLFFDYLKELDRLWTKIEKSDSIDSSLLPIHNFQKYFIKTLETKERNFLLLEKKGFRVSRQDKETIVLTAKKAAFYYSIRELYNSPCIDKAMQTACFYFLREYCYSSMFRFNKEGGFNVPYGGRSYDLKSMSIKIVQMQSTAIKEKLKYTEIGNSDFEEFLNLYDLKEDDFIFLDPPYDSDFSTYDNNSFGKTDQIRLADFLKNTRAKWMLIIKKTEFIYNLYKNFYMVEYNKNYLVSFQNRNTKNARHILITNYPIGE